MNTHAALISAYASPIERARLVPSRSLDATAAAEQQAQEEAKAHAGAGFALRSPTEESDDEGWPEDPTDAYAAFLDRPAGSFGVDSASYYSFVTQGAFSVDDVLRSGGLA